MFGRYAYTPERDAMLREAYATSSTRGQLSKKLHAFMAVTKISHGCMHRRAKMLGLKFIAKQAWTADEDRYLLENVRVVSVNALAKGLHRSTDSVKNRLHRLEQSYRVSRDGYTQQDAAWLLGVSEVTVRRWMQRGWLKPHRGLFSENGMRSFLCEHLGELNLGRADQDWLKNELLAMLRWQPTEEDDLVIEQECAATETGVHAC